MKKGIYAILAALAVFALVMTGCPTDDTGGNKDVEKSANTNLTSVSIAGGAPAGYTNDSRKRVLSEIADDKLFELNVSNSLSTNAEITLNYTESFKGVARIAKVVSTATVVEDNFDTQYNKNSKPAKTFANGDKLYVKMTAEDNKTVMYYGYKVLIGNDATLVDSDEEKGITFDGIPVGSLGLPKGTLAEIDAPTNTEIGKIQFPVGQPDIGYKVVVKPNDPDATVTISRTPVESSFAAVPTTPIKFNDDSDVLYVKVVSWNTEVTNYYKIALVLKRTINLNYGTVENLDISAAGESEDPAWDAISWVYIDRVNTTEGQGILDYPENETRTHGRAKLIWDEDGIWVYAQVWENTVSPEPGTHEQSSVEVFVNEAYSNGVVTGSVTGDAQQNGGQYRLGANGERTGAPSPAVSMFDGLGKYKAQKMTGNMPASYKTTNITNGYVLIFQVPWRFPNLYPLAGDKTISMELQINATGDEGNRVGVLNWNNENSNSYASLADYGEATLRLNGNILKPQRPAITKQPVSTNVDINATVLPPLTVEAASVDGGNLKYQWYTAATVDAEGAAVTTGTGGTTASYTPAISTEAESATFFYVEIINTKGGVDSAKRVSNKVKYSVVDPDVVLNEIELVLDTDPNYDSAVNGLVFTNEGGWGDYSDVYKVPIPSSFSITGYEKVVVTYIGYLADGTTVGNMPGSRWNLDISVKINDGDGATLGDFGYNGSAMSGDAASGIVTEWNFDTAILAGLFDGGQGSVLILATNKTNKAPDAIEKLVIKNVTMVPKAE
ncbi:MAG: hypothetical protein LBC52_05470 [Treponema sp.]|jgi:hypothetical protein|nr:hypothetical protein [Treponema sp.]